MSRRKILKILITISLLISILISFGLFSMMKNTKNTTKVWVLSNPIPQGVKITEDMFKGGTTDSIKFKELEIGADNLPSNLVKVGEEEKVINSFTKRPLYQDEYLYTNSLSTDYKKDLDERARFGATAVKISNLQSVNSSIKPDDFVGITIIYKLEEESNEAGAIPAGDIAILEDPLIFPALRVLGLYSNEGSEVTSKKGDTEVSKSEVPANANNQDKKLNPDMVVFDATPEQRAALLKANVAGQIHLTIIPKPIQDEYRKEWGLVDENGNPLSPDYYPNLKELMEQGIIPSSLPGSTPNPVIIEEPEEGSGE